MKGEKVKLMMRSRAMGSEARIGYNWVAMEEYQVVWAREANMDRW